MECRERRHSFKLLTSYPVRLTRSLGHTSLEEPREWRERARQAAATRLGGNLRKVSPCRRESSLRNMARCLVFSSVLLSSHICDRNTFPEGTDRSNPRTLRTRCSILRTCLLL